MITVEMIKNAQEMLCNNWKEAGENTILECLKSEPLNMSCAEFLKHCTCCGGNWGGMLLTGLRELRPNVWEAIPDEMGCMAWGCICATLTLLSVDTSKE